MSNQSGLQLDTKNSDMQPVDLTKNSMSMPKMVSQPPLSQLPSAMGGSMLSMAQQREMSEMAIMNKNKLSQMEGIASDFLQDIFTYNKDLKNEYDKSKSQERSSPFVS